MSFIEEARRFLQQKILPDIEEVQKKEGYIHRLLFREEANIDEALAFRQLYQHQQDNNDILEDKNLEKESNLALIGNARRNYLASPHPIQTKPKRLSAEGGYAD